MDENAMDMREVQAARPFPAGYSTPGVYPSGGFDQAGVAAKAERPPTVLDAAVWMVGETSALESTIDQLYEILGPVRIPRPPAGVVEEDRPETSEVRSILDSAGTRFEIQRRRLVQLIAELDLPRR